MFLEQLEQRLGFSLTEEQGLAAQKLSNFLFHSPEKKIFILSGYAGTGKTSLMGGLVKVLPSYGLRPCLLAPTGRATKVLENRSGKTASTIHKHIYYSSAEADGSLSLKLKLNKSTSTVYIVDEASMIGQSEEVFQSRGLLDDFLAFATYGLGNKVIFIGDTAQLPPVGSNFSPALNAEYLENSFSLGVSSCQLTQVVRQALHSGILRNASNIRWAISKDRISLPILKTQDMEDVKQLGADELEDTLRAEYREHGVNEVVIITKTNNLANRINQYVRQRVLEKENIIDAGETIMAVKNNYFWTAKQECDTFIANGDMLRINRILGYEDAYGLRFADLVVSFIDYAEERELELTVVLDTLFDTTASLSAEKQLSLYEQLYNYYSQRSRNKAEIRSLIKQDKHYNALQVKFANALTCHKAQGGDWHSVFVQQGFFTPENLSSDYFRWLYTAITRSRKRLYLVGFSEDFFAE